MGERDPTIVQDSTFTTKTPEGQDIEFQATLKFYINPGGEVNINAPGGIAQPGSQIPATGGQVRTPSKTSRYDGKDDVPTYRDERPPGVDDDGQLREDIDRPDTDTGSTVTPKTEPSVTVKEEKPTVKSGSENPRDKQGSRGIARDKSIDRAFPRGPPNNCPITQFVPDPCRAINDLQKSLSLWLGGVFGSSPHNNNSGNSSAADVKDDKTESEIIQNEKKYDL